MIMRNNWLALAAISFTAVGLISCGTADRPAADALEWQATRADEDGFSRAPVILTSGNESVLIDSGFRLSDGQELADTLKATGKPLTTVYISSSDPDYYFGLRPVVEAFPDAQVIAPNDVVAAINENVERKIATWTTQLGDDGPRAVAEAVIAQPSSLDHLTIGDATVEIVAADNLPNRYYLRIPTLDAIVGGNLVFSDLHVWVADLPTLAERQHWVSALERMIASNPEIVVAGHAASGTDNGTAALRFTRDYLIAFNEADAQTATSADLITAMLERYPDLAGTDNLELGARVVKGEMQWG